ncbi:hypothetical protein ABZ543_13060 [Streptomyces roseifaciens]
MTYDDALEIASKVLRVLEAKHLELSVSGPPEEAEKAGRMFDGAGVVVQALMAVKEGAAET